MSRRTLSHRMTAETRSDGAADEAATAAGRGRITNREYYQLGSVSRRATAGSNADGSVSRALHNPDTQDDDRQDPVGGSVLLLMWIGLVVALAGFSLLAFYVWSVIASVG